MAFGLVIHREDASTRGSNEQYSVGSIEPLGSNNTMKVFYVSLRTFSVMSISLVPCGHDSLCLS